MLIEYLLYLTVLLIVFLLVINITTAYRNKELEIEIERLRGRIQMETLRGELNLAKHQIENE